MASAAIAKGLLPLAQQVLSLQASDEDIDAQVAQHVSQDKGLPLPEDVLAGVKHIIAEMASDNAAVRPWTPYLGLGWKLSSPFSGCPPPQDQGRCTKDRGAVARISASKVEIKSPQHKEGSQDESKGAALQPANRDGSVYSTYEARPSRAPTLLSAHTFSIHVIQTFTKLASQLKAHQTLALNRGEKEKFLRLEIDVDNPAVLALMRRHYGLQEPAGDDGKAPTIVRRIIEEALADSLDRLLLPSLKRELRGKLTEHAEQQAISVFARNVEKVLIAPPIRYEFV